MGQFFGKKPSNPQLSSVFYQGKYVIIYATEVSNKKDESRSNQALEKYDLFKGQITGHYGIKQM